MADGPTDGTARTEADLLTNFFQAGQANNAITTQDLRDLIVSMKTINPELITGLDNPPHQEGLMFYDNEHKAISYYNEDVDVTLNIGQEMVLRCINNSGVTVTDGDIVFISGGDEHIPEITKAIASTNTPDVIGIVTSEADNTETCYVTIFGLVHNIDMSLFTEGDILYLSDSVTGGFTDSAPTLPIESYIIGTVIEASVDGQILAHPTRVNRSNETTAFTAASHSLTQAAGDINEATPVAFNTSSFLENMTHSTTVDNSEFTMDIAGVYAVTVGLQLAHVGGGTSTISAWMQIDEGGGFVDIPDSAVRQDLSNNDTRVLFLNGIGRWAVGDIGRVMWATSNLAGELVAFAANSPVPAIPSVIINVAKIGNE